MNRYIHWGTYTDTYMINLTDQEEDSTARRADVPTLIHTLIHTLTHVYRFFSDQEEDSTARRANCKTRDTEGDQT
jgi:hypothetical protein